MKSKTANRKQEPDFYRELGPKERQHLKYILSPLELSALRHNYKPFNFRFEGQFIFMSTFACKQLLDMTRSQVSFFTNRVQREGKSDKIPRKLRDAFEDPGEILSLPAYTRNCLCRLECYSMFKIMILGRQYFLDRKEFGKKSMKVLDGLFEKHGCSKLFI